MNHSILLQSPFQLDCPPNSNSDYSGSQRQLPGSTGFSMDEDDSSRRVGAHVHPLAHPVSMPASNGLRYTPQQSTMQDMPFATSPSMLMSPADSCTEAFSPASNSMYTHSPGLPYDRMSDFRNRVTLQPPNGMSIGMQSPSTTVAGNGSMMSRSDNYSYTAQRGPFPSLSGLGDMTRYSPYTSTPRALESNGDRTQNMMFNHAGNMLIEPMQRLSQHSADAPPFNDTTSLHPIVSGNQTIKPEIQANIHKGFFKVDDKWTCYRRNYFSVTCSFSAHPSTQSPLFVKFADQGTERIASFAMSISAIVNGQYGETRELVQHTPKRDKQSERRPAKVPLQPSLPPPLMLGHNPTSNSNHLGFSLGSTSGIGMDYTTYPTAQQPSQPPTQHTFERIQFQKATANNGKRRAQQQYYNLVVELYAQIEPVGAGSSQWVKIARRQSHPMVVRGRSPGHYKDGRRDSTTSMGPDGGSGAVGDGGGAVLPPSIGPTARSHLGLMPYDSTRGGAHYGRGEYRPMTEQSPPSDSLVSSSSSSAFDINILNDSMNPMDSIKNTTSMDSYHQDPTFAVTSAERKMDQFRSLPSYEYDSMPKDEAQNNFATTYDTMVPMLSTEQSSRLGRVGSMAGYDPVYPRSNDGNALFRFDPIHDSQSLAT